MDVVGRINTLIWAWVQSLRSAKRVSIFLPFFIFSILQGLALTVLILFFLPPLSRLLVPLMARLYGETALHYPHHYVYLPHLFAGANRWLLNPLVSWLIIGTATLMFAAGYLGQKPRLAKSFGGALRQIVPLFVVGLVEWAVVSCLMWLTGLSVQEVLQWRGQSQRLFRIGGFLFNVALITPFAFTAAQVVLGGRGIWGALKGSFSLAKSNFGVTYLIFAVPSLLTFAINSLAGKAPQVVSKFSPELVIFLLSSSILVTLVVNFVIVGALTALYLYATKGVR